jgi:hypothetical protein
VIFPHVVRTLNFAVRTRWLAALLPSIALAAAVNSTAQRPSRDVVVHFLADGASIELPTDWVETDANEPPPSVVISEPQPLLHFSQVMVFLNERQHAMLKLASSQNPFAGRDSYWLDAQLHSPNNSGVSLPDVLFHYFFPPPPNCLENSTDAYAGAGRASVANGAPDLEVFLECHFASTLRDFFSAQVSRGVVLRQTEQHQLHAHGVVNDFYLAPMQEVNSAGLTFYVFEARGLDGLSAETLRQFALPANLAGAQPDFFWAVGAKSPFPFVGQPPSLQARLVHVAFAGVSTGADTEHEFMALLEKVRSK